MRRRGYRGLLRELQRTGGREALWLQLRGGISHVLRSLRRRRGDGVEAFLRNYGEDGLAMPSPDRRALWRHASRCLVCGLCSAECARIGASPPLDPEEAVVAAARSLIDWRKLSRTPGEGGPFPCTSCRACHAVCPVAIPIADIEREIADL